MYVSSSYTNSMQFSLSLSLSCHPSLSSITPAALLSCILCLHRAGQPTLAHPCAQIYKRRLQCPTCLVCLIWIVCEMGGRWPYSCCFMGYCFKDLFKTAHNILCSSYLAFSLCFLSIHMVNPYGESIWWIHMVNPYGESI